MRVEEPGRVLREIVERRRAGPSAAQPDDGARLASAIAALSAEHHRSAPLVLPWLVELWASGPESDLVRACEGELATVCRRWRGTTEGLEVMAEALAAPGSHRRFGVAIRPRESWRGAAGVVALLVLEPLFRTTHDRNGRPTGHAYPRARKALERDEWIAALAALRDDELGTMAYAAIHGVPAERIPPLPSPPLARPRGDALARYRAGEREAAWQSLSDLGALGPDAREEARAVATEMMRIVRANAEAIVEVLIGAGYPFESEPLGDPRVVRRGVRDLSEGVGGLPPVSLEVFWEVVGGVDLCRREDGPDCELDVGESILFRNPLQVLAPTDAPAQVDDWSRNPRRAPWLALDLSADELHKEWTSGGQGYWMRVPSAYADGRVYGEPHALWFVPYLRLNFEHCGFLGYERRQHDPSYRRLVERLRHRLAPF